MSGTTLRESLFAGTTVLLFGRRFEGLALVNENNQAMTGCDAELKDNTPLDSPPILRALQAHLKARGATAGDAKPGLARIYGFSYLGNYYKMAEPTVLLVYGDGTKVPASTAPVPMNDIGVEFKEQSFSEDVRMWAMDQADYSVRIDITPGWLQDILLDAEVSPDANVTGAALPDGGGQGSTAGGAGWSGAA